MSRNILSIVVKLLLHCLLLVGIIDAQKPRKYPVEGEIVAFQKNNRCPSCEGYRGFATQNENWIIRIDKWGDNKFESTRYVLAIYFLYDRSLSETEINKKLKFVLRERMEHEQNQDCVGNIAFNKGEDNFVRPAEFSDYELTEPGKAESIPSDFKKLHCFIVDKLPIVIK